LTLADKPHELLEPFTLLRSDTRSAEIVIDDDDLSWLPPPRKGEVAQAPLILGAVVVLSDLA
jgi:hypothetical protein